RQLLESAAPPAPPATAADVDPDDPPSDPIEAIEAAMISDVRAALAGLTGLGDDPALHRLLPDGHRDDPFAAAQFRQGPGESVRVGKVARIDVALAALETADERGRITLDAVTAQAFLVALTDVRLVLGQRLGLSGEGDVEAVEAELADASEDDPRLPLVLAYDFTTWLQESLAGALLP
ncbi:MAG: DUF2017 family protein, partial [Micrococcales bacterium]|nr:DUF2017 family protein [Micrococcales bacterium]